jgi:quinoprotein relay system zinc metallohydrolase 2
MADYASLYSRSRDSRPRNGIGRRAVLAGGFCLCCAPSPVRASGPMAVQEVAPGLFLRRGVDQDATAKNLDAIANVGFIVGRDGVLVTDSGGSLADGERLRAAIRQTTPKSIRYVVISHVHPDHAFGAAAFRQDDPVFVGHARLAAAFASRGAFYRKRLEELLGPGRAGEAVMPTMPVADKAAIDLGDRPVAFTAHGVAHTDCDLSMLDHKSGLLLPADLLFVRRVPALDGSLLGWLRELDKLAAVGAARAVPGHGPLVVEFSSAAADLRRYLVALRGGVREAIAAGVPIEDAVRTVAQSERGKWLLFDDYNGRNVTEAYRELEWE